jgi:C4-dicarboxylate transporter DctQ subunit
MSVVSRILKFFTSTPVVLRNIALVVLTFITVILFLESAIRTLFGYSIVPTNEVGGAALVLIVFLSLAWLYQMGGHLTVSVVVDRIPNKPRRYLDLFLSFLSLFFVSFATYTWVTMMSATYESGRRFYLLHIVEWPFQLMAVIGWVALGLAVLNDIVKRLMQLLGKSR